MKTDNVRHVYGPVPSRRLGRSLGIDLVPFKTCTYDCVYCQLGRTTDLTLDRAPYVPADVLVAECMEVLRTAERPDIISLAGSGEPTLNSQIGAVIRGIKQQTDIPVAVLTNGEDGRLVTKVALKRALQIYFKIDPPAPTFLDMPEEALREYEGNYELPMTAFELKLNKDHLVLYDKPRGGFPTPDSPIWTDRIGPLGVLRSRKAGSSPSCRLPLPSNTRTPQTFEPTFTLL